LWPNTISSIIIRPSLRNFYWSGYLHLLWYEVCEEGNFSHPMYLFHLEKVR
jgi:hypothetical protein